MGKCMLYQNDKGYVTVESLCIQHHGFQLYKSKTGSLISGIRLFLLPTHNLNQF